MVIQFSIGIRAAQFIGQLNEHLSFRIYIINATKAVIDQECNGCYWQPSGSFFMIVALTSSTARRTSIETSFFEKGALGLCAYKHFSTDKYN